MQLGFVTAILHDLPFDEVLAFAAGEGFATVEPMCWPVERAGVRLSALGYYPKPCATATMTSRR